MFRYDIYSMLFKKKFCLPKKSPFYTFDSILQVESLYSRLYFSLHRALCIIKKNILYAIEISMKLHGTLTVGEIPCRNNCTIRHNGIGHDCEHAEEGIRGTASLLADQ